MALINFKQARLPEDPTLKSVFTVARDAVAAGIQDMVSFAPQGLKKYLEKTMTDDLARTVDRLKILLALPDMQAAEAREVICMGLARMAYTHQVADISITDKIRSAYQAGDYECPDVVELRRECFMSDLSRFSGKEKALAALDIIKNAEMFLAHPDQSDDELTATLMSKDRWIKQSASIAQGTIPDTLHLMMTKAVAKLQPV